MQAAAAAAERRARDNVWCPCSHRGDFLSAEDAIIVEEMSTPAPCRLGAHASTSNPMGASAPAPRLRHDARHSRSATAPQQIVDLTLSDDDEAHPAASQGALALSPRAGAGAPDAGALCGAANLSGAAARELLQYGAKRQRPEAKAVVSEAEMSKGQAGPVIQLGASAESLTGEVLSGACLRFISYQSGIWRHVCALLFAMSCCISAVRTWSGWPAGPHMACTCAQLNGNMSHAFSWCCAGARTAMGMEGAAGGLRNSQSR